jgi:heme/copper-type cytochrome/quinol oxidase subunit 3
MSQAVADATLEGVAIETLDPDGRRVLDVSALPTAVFGPRSPVWWGNTLLMLTESMSVGLLIASYLYLRQNFAGWPPPNPNAQPPLLRPLPDLPLPTIELVVMLVSCVFTMMTNRAARAIDGRRTRLGLWVSFVVILALIAARFYEFQGLHVRWNDNAYASIVWTLISLHLTYLLVGAGETLIMALWLCCSELDEHHAHDVILTGIYWYWTVGAWVLIYAVVYIGARVL